MQHKELAPLHRANADVDYWANDLLYTSSAWGTFNYSSKADSVPGPDGAKKPKLSGWLKPRP
jgi:hypothetical protein